MSPVIIGCSGFTYDHWRGTFYPEGLPKSRWLQHYCSVFPSVELNVTFYRLPRVETFEKWRRETPARFVFALKGSRFITHNKKLLDAEGSVRMFFDRALHLKDKLQVVLWQLPPAFPLEERRFEAFLRQIAPYPVRNAFEFRHASWITESVFALCREHGVCLCMADWPPFLGDLPITANFVYLRRHGTEGNYRTRYSEAQLKDDAGMLRGYAEAGLDGYVYFNNDYRGYAPENATQLMAMLDERASP